MSFRTRLNAARDRTTIRDDEPEEFQNRLKQAFARLNRPTPSDVSTGVGGFMSGVYKNIADIAGAVPWAAERLARGATAPLRALVGDDSPPATGDGREHQQAIRDFFAKTGLTNPEHGQRPGVMERAGYSLIPNLAQLVPIGRAGKAIEEGVKMGAKTGVGKQIIRDLSKEMAARPGITLATEAGANIGAEAGSSMDPSLAPPGALAGGSAAALGANVIKRSVQTGVGMMSQRAPSMSLLPGGRDPYRLQQFANTQVARDIAITENRIKELAQRGLTRSNSGKAETAFRARLDKLRETARSRMGVYAQAIPGNPVPLQGAYQRIGSLIQNLRQTGMDTAIPDRRLLSRFFNNLAGQQDNAVDNILADTFANYEAPPVTPATASRDNVLDFMRQLRQQRQSIERGDFAQGSPAVKEQHRQMRGTLRQMEEALWDALRQANPGDKSVDEFRTFSNWYFSTFERGPLADLYAKPAGTVPAADTLQHILKQHGGSDVLQRLSQPGSLQVPNQRRGTKLPTVLDPQIEGEARDVIDNYLRDTFRGAEGDLQAKGAAVNRLLNQLIGNRGMDDPRRSLEGLTRLAGEYVGLRDKMTTALAADTAIRNSALARYANDRQGLARMWEANDAEALRMIRQFTKPGVMQNSEARDALKTELLFSLFERHGGRAGNMADFLVGDIFGGAGRHRVQRLAVDVRSSRTQTLLREVMSPEELGRFNKIINTADSLARGDERFVLRKVLGLPVLFGRVVGASVGRNMPMGKGTIQVPGAFARLGGRFMEEATRSTPTDVLLQLAIFDPKWEKVLMRRMPRDTKEARALARQLRRLISISVGAEEFAREDLTGEGQ